MLGYLVFAANSLPRLRVRRFLADTVNRNKLRLVEELVVVASLFDF